MFWLVSAFAGLFYVFAKLGAMSVWIKVLALVNQLLFLIIAVFLIRYLWKKRGNSRDKHQNDHTLPR